MLAFKNILANKSQCKVEEDNGRYRRFYVGLQNTTQKGNLCLNWNNVTKAKNLIGKAGVGDHNFCRKPTGSAEFCYISQTEIEECKVRTCGR